MSSKSARDQHLDLAMAPKAMKRLLAQGADLIETDSGSAPTLKIILKQKVLKKPSEPQLHSYIVFVVCVFKICGCGV